MTFSVRLSITLILFFAASCETNHLLKEVKRLDYPSASGIENFDGRLYLVGDDANYILVLDSGFNKVDSIPLFNYREKRIPKPVKPDLEGTTTIYGGKESLLLSIGSGSLPPWRNSAYFFHYKSRKTDSIRLDSFYSELQSLGVKEINIEGICSIQPTLVLANRGNLSYRSNQLIFTNLSVLYGRTQGPINIVKLGGNNDTSEFRGVSGLSYSKRSDRLLLTVSTEATASATEDGAIGKSYLWMIRNFSSKRNWKAINPDLIIDLEEVDARFKGQKIESVCILKETKDFLHLALAADNDDGSSTLFRLVVEK
jgi:hypothetical protein